MKANYNFKLEIKDFYWKNMNNEESKNHSYLEFLRFNLYFFYIIHAQNFTQALIKMDQILEVFIPYNFNIINIQTSVVAQNDKFMAKIISTIIEIKEITNSILFITFFNIVSLDTNQINIQNFKILDCETSDHKLRLFESIYINKFKQSRNQMISVIPIRVVRVYQ